MKNRLRTNILWVFLLAIWPGATVFGHSQTSQQSPAPSQDSQKQDSAAEPAKKAEKPKPKKVYTEEDLSGMRGNSVSVVGDADSSPARSNAANPGGPKSSSGKPGVTPMSGQDEKYWRGKASELLGEMAAIDQEIAKTKEEIKKYGADGFDATSGLQKNTIYIDNRASKVQQLEKRKSDLEKKLDQLQEEGRKAGASPAWFR